METPLKLRYADSAECRLAFRKRGRVAQVQKVAQHVGAGIDVWIGGHRRNVSTSGVETTRAHGAARRAARQRLSDALRRLSCASAKSRPQRPAVPRLRPDQDPRAKPTPARSAAWARVVMLYLMPARRLP